MIVGSTGRICRSGVKLVTVISDGCTAFGDDGSRKIFLIERKQVGIPKELGPSRQIGMHLLAELADRNVVKVSGPPCEVHGMLGRERYVLADLILG